MRFTAPIDIGNRTCQLIGVDLIDQAQGFDQDYKPAQEIGFAYDKIRRAELMKDVWKFATRKVCLRPVQDGFMLLAPTLWTASVTYGFGALVTDDENQIWQSITQDNVDCEPGLSFAWELYCGSMAVQPFAPQIVNGAPNPNIPSGGYYAGELVYQTPGDGTYTVYMSTQNGNAQDPRQPTQWQYETQYLKNQIVQQYATWLVGTTYAAGNIVALNGQNYVSLSAGNVGNNPATASQKWALISITAAPTYYDSQNAYAVGNFTTYLGVNYICILAATSQTPSTSPTYWVPLQAGTFYASLIDFNTNNPPTSAPALWNSTTTYATGNQVGGSDGNIYTSIGNSNVGNDPLLTTGVAWTNTGVLNPWTTVNNFGSAADQWIQIFVALTDLFVMTPISQPGGTQGNLTFQKHLFRLPANYMRRAPQDPKQGSASWLGAPTGMMYDDWEMEGDYLTSQTPFPIILRFVADVTQVGKFDDLFCETLAASLAVATCETITQSTAKLQSAINAYNTAHTKAALVNGIETGPSEPAVDDWISCRL